MGSSKGMEADAALHLIEKLHKQSATDAFIEAIVADDDSSMRAVLSHKSTNKKKGRLPEYIPQPRFLADPTHRVKVVAKTIFMLANQPSTTSICTKVDALRFKKYFGYMIKQTRTGTIEEMREKCMAVIEHLFDNHIYCDPKWCKPSRIAKKRNKKLPRPPLAQTAGP